MKRTIMPYINKLSRKFRLIAFFALLVSPLFFLPEVALSFWKTCLKIDSSFYYHIIDPDIIEIGNSEYFAFVAVECEGVPRKHAFSNCANGILFLSVVINARLEKLKPNAGQNGNTCLSKSPQFFRHGRFCHFHKRLLRS